MKNKKKYKSGGKIEIENGELVVAPNGDSKTFSGKTHKAGGIDLDVTNAGAITEQSIPNNSTIFSNKTKVRNADGKLEGMKTRKKRRDKVNTSLLANLDKVMKASEKNPNKINKDTLSATQSNVMQSLQQNFLEEIADIDYMNVVNDAVGNEDSKAYGGSVEKYANGGGPGLPMDALNNLYQLLNGNTGITQESITNPTGNRSDFSTVTQDTGANVNTVAGIPDPSTSTKKGLFSKLGENLSNLSGNDLGMAGLGLNVLPAGLTIANRAFDTPNINQFANVGRDADDALYKAKGNIDAQRDLALSDLELATSGAFNKNRNATRSRNTLSALNISATGAKDRAIAGLAGDLNKQYLALGAQEATQDLQASTLAAKGASIAEENNKKDRDNFYTNFSQNLSDIAGSVTTAGQNLNQEAYNEDFLSVLPALSKYNIGFERDEEGKLTLTRKSK